MIIVTVAVTSWFQLTHWLPRYKNNTSSEGAEQDTLMKFSATGTNSNVCFSGSLSFLQRCLYPQVRPRHSRGFFRALHSHLNRHGSVTGYSSHLSSCISNLYLSQEKALPCKPHLLAQESVQTQKPTCSWTPKQPYLFHALHPSPTCHSELSGESVLQYLSQSFILFPNKVLQLRAGQNLPFQDFSELWFLNSQKEGEFYTGKP